MYVVRVLLQARVNNVTIRDEKVSQNGTLMYPFVYDFAVFRKISKLCKYDFFAFLTYPQAVVIPRLSLLHYLHTNPYTSVTLKPGIHVPKINP